MQNSSKHVILNSEIFDRMVVLCHIAEKRNVTDGTAFPFNCDRKVVGKYLRQIKIKRTKGFEGTF